jgi:hypothetical protein
MHTKITKINNPNTPTQHVYQQILQQTNKHVQLPNITINILQHIDSKDQQNKTKT